MKQKLLVYTVISLMALSAWLSQPTVAQVSVNVAPTELKIGGLFPLTGTLSGGGVEREAAFRLAIEEINNDTTTLLPATTLTYTVRDTATDATTGASAATDLAALPVHVLIGAASSTVSKAIAAIAETNKIPQISYSSTNADLSDKTTYPYFLRVVPPDSVQGAALASILYSDLDITTVSTLATSDDYGAGGIGVFETEYKALGGTVTTSQQFAQGASDVSTQLQALVDAGTKVVVLNSIVGDAKTVFSQAAGVGITPANGWQWVGTDGSTQNQIFTDESNVVDTAVRDAMQGMFGTAPNRGEGARYEAFLDLWESCNGQTTTEYAGCGDRDPNTFATFAYDAVYAFAYAAQSMIDASGDPTNGTALLEELAVTEFNGATGAVSFDANLDREGVYDILNHNGTQFIDIGNWDKVNGMTLTKTISFAQGYFAEDRTTTKTDTETETAVTVTVVSTTEADSPGFGFYIMLIAISSVAIIIRSRKD